MSRPTALHRRVGAAGLALVAGLAMVAPPVSAAEPQRPDRDPFYSYAGRTPLAEVAPGTVLRSRRVQLSLGPQSTPVTAAQLLYRTSSQLGGPTVTVTTVLEPTPRPVVPSIVGYLSFYDGLGSQCDPSYTLAGGDPGTETQQQAEEEELLMLWYLSMGWVVTVPDFEGTRLAWMAGREAGFGTLDAIRATESYLQVDDSTKVGLSGYSGGALAADWANELAPSYASELQLVGVAAGGVPVDDVHLFDYVNGDDVYSSVLPGMLLGLARGEHIDLRRYLSPYGARLVRRESDVCIASVFGDYPGLRYQRLLRPRYRELTRAGSLTRMLRKQRMGSAPGHPRAPMLLAVGNSDGTGDGVMRADDVRDLARHYCAHGVPVQYDEYDGADHTSAGAFFDPATGPFLQERFAGAPFAGNCASLGPPGYRGSFVP